jgi:arylsulfatase A-like enzyme
MTLGEVCKSKGYATAAFGKWHLGHHPQFLPPRHGFDEYFGLPYSNDMWPRHPVNPQAFPDLPLIEGEKVIQLDPDQTQLTTWYTERAVKFIEKNKTRPFFLYVAHNMPHVPLHVSDKFKGKSARGLFGDVIQEIDWSVGEILASLKRNGLDENTLVIFTCDNGPWLVYGDHAGSAKPLREGKGSTWDGGVRVPFVARWPAKIPAGLVCREPAMTMTIDLLPTIAKLIDAELPKHKIDGREIVPLLTAEKGAKSPHEAFYFYWLNRIDAVRSGKWKLHVPHDYPHPDPVGGGGKPGKVRVERTEVALYDLENDIEEKTNLADKHTDVVARLMVYVEQAREDLGDTATKRTGKTVREPGRVAEAK